MINGIFEIARRFLVMFQVAGPPLEAVTYYGGVDESKCMGNICRTSDNRRARIQRTPRESMMVLVTSGTVLRFIIPRLG